MTTPRRLAVVLLVTLSCSAVRALAQPSEADKKLLATVAARVYAEVGPDAKPVEGFPKAFDLARPGPKWAWPPLVAISADPEINAFATVTYVRNGEVPDLSGEPGVVWVEVPGFPSKLLEGDPDEAAKALPVPERGSPEGTYVQPVMLFKQGYLDHIVKGQEGPLAGCFGHELAHHLHGHTLEYDSSAPLVAYADNRQRESDADALGTEIALRAKFDYDSIVAGALEERKNDTKCSFQGMSSTHPGWDDRMALIDSRQREKWRSIDAFENGVYFLMTEQYYYAEKCFKEVVEKQPKCYEAWANKGYAELMQFCDGLEPDDLREFDVGQLVVGGFYTRPGSLTRGVDVDMWFAAVGDLRQALILKPDLVMAKANLAVAWLLYPEGKESGKAEQLFREVNDAIKAGHFDEDIDPLVHATLLVNAGVAENANGDPAAAGELFDQAKQLIASAEDAEKGEDLANALRFNQARMAAARSDPEPRKSAIGELEKYLSSTSPSATWWPLAYEQYEKLCHAASVEPKPRKALAEERNTVFRPVSGVTLPDGREVKLNEPVKPLEESLGQDVRQVLVERSNVHRRRYAQHGLDLLCTSKVLAIRLLGAKAPPIVLKASGLTQKSHELRPGMTVDELDAALGGDSHRWERRCGASTSIIYRFYCELGFGARISDEGTVMELIVAQIPRDAAVDD
jgi:tetratricopeptide (TPR) repeat protein